MSVKITHIDFNKFKAFENYSVRISRMNILVGPNNSGKSTILNAIKTLAVGIRRARSKRPDSVFGFQESAYGYHLNPDAIPMSLKNVHTDLEDVDTDVTFTLSNGNKLKLFFPSEGGCILLPIAGRLIQSPKAFTDAFPISIGMVPGLAPLEPEEELLTAETVRSGMFTHRASRHFRNYWLKEEEQEFDKFAATVAKTWPGMEVEPPQIISGRPTTVVMFCREHRMTREIYWCGAGFQIWCQLLTHISAAKERGDTMLVIDEPEIFLHPDVQRQLLPILRDVGPDLIVATHSTEIMSEADPGEIVYVDKTKRRSERLRDIRGVQAALHFIGSAQNILLTKVAKNGKLLFVEGERDGFLLRKFAKKLGFDEIARNQGVTWVESEGLSNRDRVRHLSWGVEKALRKAISIGAIFDRDFYCPNEVTAIEQELSSSLDYIRVHGQKEIENYLLVPSVLDRVVRRALADRAERNGTSPVVAESSLRILERVTEELRNYTQAQYIAKRVDFYSKTKRDSSSITQESLEYISSQWSDLHERLKVVSGKDALKAFRREIQEHYGVTFTDSDIVDAFKREEIHEDIKTLIQALDEYIRRPL